MSIIELQARPLQDTNKDGTVSEEEVRFFLSGAESFDRETFRLSGFHLLKPYLVEEQEGSEATGSEEGADTTADVASEAAADDTAGDEETEAPATSTTPEVYDPWRANQGKDIEVYLPPLYTFSFVAQLCQLLLFYWHRLLSRRITMMRRIRRKTRRTTMLRTRLLPRPLSTAPGTRRLWRRSRHQ